MQHITKNFGGVCALDDVCFEIPEGGVRGLIGENGAGKSTLMKILAGVHTEYQGDLMIHGNPVRFTSASDALEAGIGMVYQELSVIDCLTVAENAFLGKQPVGKLGTVSWKQMQDNARENLKDLGIEVDVSLPLNLLPFSIRQMIEIAKVIFSGARIIILDEPTSSLSHGEIEQLFRLVRTLKDRKHTIVFISHLIEDVISISDSITVLKDGRVVETVRNENLDKHHLIASMTGATEKHLVRDADEVVTLRTVETDPVLRLENLSKKGEFEDVSFTLHKGEILGLYGPLGAGHEEVGKALFGLTGFDSGEVVMDGRRLPRTRPHHIKNRGVAYIAESRSLSLFGQFEIYKNITLPYLKQILGPGVDWLVRYGRERETAEQQIKRFGIRASSPDAPLSSLSGGNQQKVALAKWLTVTPQVIIFQEPTRGVDVGAKAEIVAAVRALKDRGLSCIVISMEPETILDLSDRILIFSRGRVVQELRDTTTSKIRILEYS
jgi:ribose transport system ATP-binding protein